MFLKPTKPTTENDEDGRSHMTVVVRVRPENDKEAVSGYPRRVVEVLGESTLIFDPMIADDAPQFCPAEQLRDERERIANRARLLHFRRREKNLTFTFDRVFDERVRNEHIFEQTTSRMLNAFLEGVNCSVFCYGATGAGKTFTMLGGRSQGGVIFFTMRALYERVNSMIQGGLNCNVKVSYLEIYNEHVRDLLASWDADYLDDEEFESFLKARLVDRQSQNEPQLSNGDEPNAKRSRVGQSPGSKSGRGGLQTSPTNGNGGSGSGAGSRKSGVGLVRARQDVNDLLLLEDSQLGVVVQGMTYHEPSSAEELMRMLEYGNLLRTQHPTDANSESSRSHAVFQVYFRQKSINCVPQNGNASTSGTQELTYHVSKFSLIDLAGSERATATSNNGMRFREGANINKSLLALGNCINALAEGKKAAHIPYRDSKLTRLLKDSLAGNCQTCMIAAVSPSAMSYEDTYNTLKYADRARAISIDSHQNVVSATVGAVDLSKMLDVLRRENAQLRSQIDSPSAVQPSHAPAPSRLQPISTVNTNCNANTIEKPAPANEALTLDRVRARLLERDLRLFRKVECWRRLKALGIDCKATCDAHDRTAQFIDANYLEQTDTHSLVCVPQDASAQLHPDPNLDVFASLVNSLCAEANEDKKLIRELLSTVGRFFGLLKCEHLVTQANVEEIERLKRQILALENVRARQFRHPLTRAALNGAEKREAGSIRWAERLEVDEPRIAYFDKPTQSDDETSLELDESAIDDLLNAGHVVGLDAQALSRAHVAYSVRSLFTKANLSSSAPGPTKLDKKTAAEQNLKPLSSRSLHEPFSVSNACYLDDTPNGTLLDDFALETAVHKTNIVVDEVERFKKRHDLHDKQVLPDKDVADVSTTTQTRADALGNFAVIETSNHDATDYDNGDDDGMPQMVQHNALSATFTVNSLAFSTANSSVLSNRDVNSFTSNNRLVSGACTDVADFSATIEEPDTEAEEKNSLNAAIEDDQNSDLMLSPKIAFSTVTKATDRPAITPTRQKADLVATTAVITPARQSFTPIRNLIRTPIQTPIRRPINTPLRTPTLVSLTVGSEETIMTSTAQREHDRVKRLRMARKRIIPLNVNNENALDDDERPKKQLRLDPTIDSELCGLTQPHFPIFSRSAPLGSSLNATSRFGRFAKMQNQKPLARQRRVLSPFNVASTQMSSASTANGSSAQNFRFVCQADSQFKFSKSINDVIGPIGTQRYNLFTPAAYAFGTLPTLAAPVPSRSVLKARRLIKHSNNTASTSQPPLLPPPPPTLSNNLPLGSSTSGSIPSLNRLYASTTSWNFKQVMRQPLKSNKRPT